MPELILKQFAGETKAVEGERALNVTITTNDVDRSGDIVEPGGAKLVNFRKNPVVLMSHDYSGLPIARAEDIVKTDTGITAKVVFPKEDIYPLSDTVYNLYKNKFMKAWSIGFIPIKSEDIVADEDNDSKSLGRGRRFKSWELLEFSACSVPANPHALTNMIAKGINIEPLKEAGFIEIEGEDDDEPLDIKGIIQLLEKDIILKPEETDDSIRIPVKGEEGKHKGHKIRWITVSDKEGIKGIYCIDCKKIITFVFDKGKGWTMEKAKKWMADHGKTIEDYFSKVDWDTEYEVEDIDYEELEEDIFAEEEKGVIPFKETPKAPEDEKWDAGAEVRAADISDLKVMCAWFDSENPDVKGAYKLPHHKASGHAVVWRAVAAAMAALLGARGGVAIPTSDKKGVYNHLVKHYKQFDKEPPELRDYEENIFTEGENLFTEEKIGYSLNDIYDIVKENKDLKEKIKELELKAGAVLNAKNKKDLKDAQKLSQDAQALIQRVLDSAETTEEDSVVVDDDKDDEGDDDVIDIVTNTVDNIVIDEEKDKTKDVGLDFYEIDDEKIKNIINDKIDYMMGRVPEKNKKKGRD